MRRGCCCEPHKRRTLPERIGLCAPRPTVVAVTATTASEAAGMHLGEPIRRHLWGSPQHRPPGHVIPPMRSGQPLDLQWRGAIPDPPETLRTPRRRRSERRRNALRRRRGDAGGDVPQEPDWLRDGPVPGDVPVELTADERRAREDRAEGHREGPRECPCPGDRRPAQPRAGPRGHHHGRPAPDPGRRGLGQDPRAGPPDRVPRRRQERPAVVDPGGDVHEPRRRGAARADHQPRRRARPRRPGRDIPLALCPRPAARR